MRLAWIALIALGLSTCAGHPPPASSGDPHPVRSGLPVMRGGLPAFHPQPLGHARPVAAPTAEPCTGSARSNCVQRHYGTLRAPRCGPGFALRGSPGLWACAHRYDWRHDPTYLRHQRAMLAAPCPDGHTCLPCPDGHTCLSTPTPKQARSIRSRLNEQVEETQAAVNAVCLHGRTVRLGDLTLSPKNVRCLK